MVRGEGVKNGQREDLHNKPLHVKCFYFVQVTPNPAVIQYTVPQTSTEGKCTCFHGPVSNDQFHGTMLLSAGTILVLLNPLALSRF